MGPKHSLSNKHLIPPADRFQIREYSSLHVKSRHMIPSVGNGLRLNFQVLVYIISEIANSWPVLVSWVLISFIHDLDLNVGSQKRQPLNISDFKYIMYIT